MGYGVDGVGMLRDATRQPVTKDGAAKKNGAVRAGAEASGGASREVHRLPSSKRVGIVLQPYNLQFRAAGATQPVVASCVPVCLLCATARKNWDENRGKGDSVRVCRRV